jgi:hypothetical protein
MDEHGNSRARDLRSAKDLKEFSSYWEIDFLLRYFYYSLAE